MQFVGRTVRKEFKGFGVFSGVVNSYDPATGYFEVVYEDGDSEELEFHEIASLFGEMGMVVNDQAPAAEVEQKPTRVGRKPQKRRRLEVPGDSGNNSPYLVSDVCLEESGEGILGQNGFAGKGLAQTLGKECGVSKNLNETVSVNGNLNVIRGSDRVKSDRGLNLNYGLDLNHGLNLTDAFNLNDDFNLNISSVEHLKKSACIDLNLDARADFAENIKHGYSQLRLVGTPKRDFDLNLGLDEEIKNSDVDCELQSKDNISLRVEETQKQDAGGDVEEAQMTSDGRNQQGACFEVNGATQSKGISGGAENVLKDSSLGLIEEAQKEDGTNVVWKGHDMPETMDIKDFMPSACQLKEGIPDTGIPLDNGFQGHSGSTCKEKNRRKRRKLSDSDNSTSETVMRRSSRRIADVLSAQNHFSSGPTLSSVNEVLKREHCFDLNLGLDEDIKNPDAECRGQLKVDTSIHVVQAGQEQRLVGCSEEAQMASDNKSKKEGCFEVSQGTQIESIDRSTNDVVDYRCLGLVEEVDEKNDVSGELRGSEAPGTMNAKYSLSSEVQLKAELPDTGTPLGYGYQSNSGSAYKGKNRRKRRKVSDSANSATETVLRRSGRRLAAAAFSAQNHDPSKALEDSGLQPSPAVSAVLEEVPTASGFEESAGYSCLPAKLKLPPSSGNLNLDEISVLDLFSVYACLRSFSTLLFLSPFELEDFVAALKCNVPNLLFDSIHVSLLQTLRKHLEFLSNENSPPASNCLRSLNWDLLDLITWPMFLVEYLLTYGSGLKPGFDLCKLKLFENDYYEQSAVVKIEILRCLCDEVIEVEAIRSELNRRTLATELNIDTDCNMLITSKRRRTSMDASGGSGLTEEVVDETTDWNSDECCLCKMDGNLICCDGCPAAYHLKCVGVANSLLPDGDWYCPECVIDKDKPWPKLGNSIRGAELLGVDPYGRIYYSSCGYLLVLDLCDNESPYHYYNRKDLNFLVEVLKSSDTLYNPIVGAISKQWNISVSSGGIKCDVDSLNHTVYVEHMKAHMPNSIMHLCSAPSETCMRDDSIDERKHEENSTAAQYSCNKEGEVAALLDSDPLVLNNFMKTGNQLTSSEGSAETSQAMGILNLSKPGQDDLSKSAEIASNCEIQGKNLSIGDSLASTNLDGGQQKNIQSADCGHRSMVMQSTKSEASQGQLQASYMNCYSFAWTASLVAEELSRKSTDKINEGSIKSVEDIISVQLKAISKKSTKFSWPNILNLNADAKKEKCGWCFSCKTPDDYMECFFNMNDSASGDFASDMVGVRSKWNKKGHLIDVMCYVLCMEDRLHGLLLGPWLNPHFSQLCRKNVIKEFDVASLKHLLLMLESNLHHLAFSAEWLKHVDSVATMGSSSHIVTSSGRVSSKHGFGRKRSRYSDLDPHPSSSATTGLGLFWWRGGRLSRELFNWKVLPRSLALKAARQAGCVKMPGVLYPEGSEFAKRSKCAAWRAAVEISKSVEQLALQVRELDANIRWDDIENTNLLSKLDQFRKSVRPFKKVVVRRKCTEGTSVKYLLDFGKRRIIPDIVVNYGSKVDEATSERKKYWLEESHVPLHLLKAFEEKRIARKSNKICLGKLHGSRGIAKKSPDKRGFLYLFAKAEKSENYQCGHCNKDVLIRDAVSCQYCEEFFHKRHVRKSAGAAADNCTYTCHKCHDKNSLKVEVKKGKLGSQKSMRSSTICRVLRSKVGKKACKGKKPVKQLKNQKDTVILPLRRSTRKVKCVTVQNVKVGGHKKGRGRGRGRGKGRGKFKGKSTGKEKEKDEVNGIQKQIKSRKGKSKRGRKAKKPNKGTWQKKRTQVCHAYWINGLRLSRQPNYEKVKPNDAKVKNFRSKKLLAASEQSTTVLVPPKCSICSEQQFTSTLNYIGCEICEDWFHGDAFGLGMENVGYLIGFRCHKCRNRSAPICPHMHREISDDAQLDEFNNEAGIECAEKVSPICIEESEHLALVDDSSNKDQEMGTACNLNELSAENGQLAISGAQNKEAAKIPIEMCRPDLSVELNEHISLEENTTDFDPGKIGAVTASAENEFPLSMSVCDVTGAEMGLGHSSTEDHLVQTAILGKLVHITVDSSELPSQEIVGTGKTVDGAKGTV